MGKELKRYEYRGRFYLFAPDDAPEGAELVEKKKAKKNNKGRKAADKAAEPADK